MLPFQARVDLRAMVMKGYSAFPKDPALLEHHHIGHLLGVLPLCRDAVSVFHSPSRLGKIHRWVRLISVRFDWTNMYSFWIKWLLRWLVGFYRISTLVGLIPNHFGYIKYILFVNETFVGNILNQTELICLHTVNFFHILLSNINISI